jgi:hypothetical protein
MSQNSEQFIGSIDVRNLHEYRWPIIGVLARRFVNRLELRRHERHLLDSGQWTSIRSAPLRDGTGSVYELFGTPAEGAARSDNARARS